ncbi:MAG TPA: TIM barrel protein [Armatimonadota bacterium]|jgi:sugar phosphate isomerase/epimerase
MFTERLAASSVTFRDVPLEGALHHLRAIGFTRLDLTAIRHYCDHFDPLLVDVGEAECLRVRDTVARFGMETVSITSYPANPLAKDLNGDDWASGIDAYIRLGLHLQARALILPPGSPAPPADRWRGTAEHAKPWLRDAARRAVTAQMTPSIALQSHSLLRTPQQGLDFLGLLGAKEAGLAIDPAHLAAIGEDPAAAIRQLGAAITFVVLRDTDGKDFNLPPGMGLLDYPSILASLAEIGYHGPLVLAIDDPGISPEERIGRLQRGWEYLDTLDTGWQQAA